MLTDDEITAAAARLTAGKLSGMDVDSMVQNFRILLGPLESTNNYQLQSTLEALDDTLDTRQRAAKVAACLVRLIDSDFGVDLLQSTLVSSDKDQRFLYTLFAFSLFWPIPAELMDDEAYQKFLILSRSISSSVQVTIVP